MYANIKAREHKARRKESSLFYCFHDKIGKQRFL